jgi:hypothetical protein
MEFLAEPEIELANLRDQGLTLTRVLSIAMPAIFDRYGNAGRHLFLVQ